MQTLSSYRSALIRLFFRTCLKNNRSTNAIRKTNAIRNVAFAILSLHLKTCFAFQQFIKSLRSDLVQPEAIPLE